MTNKNAGVLVVAFLVLASCGQLSPQGTKSTVGPASSPRQVQPSVPATEPSTGSLLGLLPPNGPVSVASAARVSGITCTGSIGASDSVAIVQLHDGSKVLRDYSDPLHPRTACQLPSQSWEMQLIDSRHLLAGGENYLYAVVTLPAVTYQWFQLPSGPDNFPTLLGVSPRFDAIAYLSPDLPNNTDKVHVVTAGSDAILAVVPNPHGGRCGSPEDSRPGAYQHAGQDLYALDQPIPSFNSLVVIRGNVPELQIVPPGTQFPQDAWPQGQQPAMAVWSPTSETLYYRKGGDVWKWTGQSGPQRFLPGVSWYYPTISADGTHLAYAALRSDGLHNVYLVDLAHNGAPQMIGKGARNLPAFLNSRQLWFKSEAQGPCGPGGDVPLVYDLVDGSEASSIIDFVQSVWPSTSSNF